MRDKRVKRITCYVDPPADRKANGFLIGFEMFDDRLIGTAIVGDDPIVCVFSDTWIHFVCLLWIFDQM